VPVFFPSASGLAIFKGNEALGLRSNSVSGTLATEPRHVGLTLNSDTPYAPLLLDVRDGPMVIELPPGPLICLAMDVNQRWVADMGLPGPDRGQGGRHVILPPGHHGDIPDGYYGGRSTSYRVLGGIRSLPVGGDVKAAMERLTRSKTPRRCDGRTTSASGKRCTRWSTPNRPWVGYRAAYGELAVLGIAKGRPFAPDDRMKAILQRAARIGSGQMRVQAFADRRPDRAAWPDRHWEWAALRFENGDFDRPSSVDTDAREKWFYQAIGASPAMFRRDTQAGSLYWLGQRDATGLTSTAAGPTS
jgi:hypothetical protein